MLQAAPALVRLEAYRSVHSIVARFIKDPHLRQAFSFHTLLVGGNPFSTSSIYGAEPYYASALAGLPALAPRCAWSIAAAARIYGAIGSRIHRDGPAAYRRRIGISGATKVALVLRALADAGASRFVASTATRRGLWTRPR